MLPVAVAASLTLGDSPAIQDPFVNTIRAKVNQVVQVADTVPGLKSEEFALLSKGLVERCNTLAEKGVLEVTGTDKEVRPYFVTLQALFEHVLSLELKNSITRLEGVIHTPQPATPLCNDGTISKELVDPSILADPARLFTVQARTTIIRDYLHKGADLYVVYPQEGLAKRNEAMQKTYKGELQKYPTHLFDRPLNTSIENEDVGAYYIFETSDSKRYAFAIKMTQANALQDSATFGLWFGEFTPSSPVYKRVMAVHDKLNTAQTRFPPFN